MFTVGLLIAYISAEETAFEIDHFTHFRPPWLDFGSGHTLGLTFDLCLRTKFRSN